MTGVVLDLDGTLVDSLDGLCDAAAHAVGHVGRKAPSRQAVASYIGAGTAKLLHRSLTGEMNGIAEEEIFRSAFQAFTDHYYTCCIHGTVLRQNALEVLARLRAHGRGLAVLTNKPARPTRRILEHLGLLEFFDVVISPEDVGAKKPDPRGLLLAIELLGVTAGVMVGDSRVDLETAIAANMAFVGIRGGYNRGVDLAEEVSSAHAVIDELEALPEAIIRLETSP
jgi:phosphoglycolate phosphatase